ncbi:CASP-like protein 4A3 [Rhododendron vialii]|uniref:CASP-like protein 4A3 n=1 Tax=Rhododendron vialii TaxID=182163 RepID=UPI00265ECE82|nr:CASP-like protein 4A3 [Rhododendron vialii]
MSDLDSRIESFRSALQSDDERENVKTPSVPNLPPPPGLTKEGGFGGGKEAAVLGRRLRRRRRREVMVKRAELGFRVCEVILCLVSFCVMMSDKSRGWAGDSYYRYTEFRYCVAMTLIGFAYSGFQASNLTYNLITGNHVIFHHLRYHFNFAMDQILAYLLISASSSAATRIDDWVSNWGKDKFTYMATLSVAMSLLAFAALALSTLISGYNLITIA